MEKSFCAPASRRDNWRCAGKAAHSERRLRRTSLEMLADMFQDDGLKPAGTIPEDPELEEFDFKGKPSFHLPEENPCLKAAFRIFDGLLE